MRAAVHIKGHPIHPMMVSVPIGLWTFSLVADIMYLCKIGAHWETVSAYCMAAGVISALAAAIPGFLDYGQLRDHAPRRIGLWHMCLNLAAVALYSANFLLRYNNGFEVQGMPFALSLVTFVALGISGWLGGEMIYKHRAAVEEEERPTLR